MTTPTTDARERLRNKIRTVLTAILRDADMDDDAIERELDDGKHGLLRDVDAYASATLAACIAKVEGMRQRSLAPRYTDPAYDDVLKALREVP